MKTHTDGWLVVCVVDSHMYACMYVCTYKPVTVSAIARSEKKFQQEKTTENTNMKRGSKL